MTIQDHEVPLQSTSGQNADTTEDGLHADLPHGAPIADPGEALRNPYAADVNRLNNFLMTRFPRQMSGPTRPVQEGPVDAAIRLLSGMATSGTGIQRCPEQYCNYPVNHDGDHGYVTFDR
jgi:hypothetical protein